MNATAQDEQIRLTATDRKPSTNIKGLPRGNYFTEYGYSDASAYVEVSRTEKTVTVAKVETKRDPEWQPDMHVGGFAAHCSNQSDQTWLFEKINRDWTVTLRMTKKGWAYKGVPFVEGKARRFYDYNF